jgi:GNAT superfamily N-acetyltransferase
MTRFLGPELLERGHPIDGFDSGEGSLNTWLARHARAAGGAGSAKTYVITDAEKGGRVVGYHALAAASVEHREATERATKGMGQYEIPAVLLCRLAVDHSVQGRGLGALLLRDAMLRAVSVAEEVGVRLLLAHALNDSARAFYMKFGFDESPTDEMNLQIIIKDIRSSIGAVNESE